MQPAPNTTQHPKHIPQHNQPQTQPDKLDRYPNTGNPKHSPTAQPHTPCSYGVGAIPQRSPRPSVGPCGGCGSPEDTAGGRAGARQPQSSGQEGRRLVGCMGSWNPLRPTQPSAGTAGPRGRDNPSQPGSHRARAAMGAEQEGSPRGVGPGPGVSVHSRPLPTCCRAPGTAGKRAPAPPTRALPATDATRPRPPPPLLPFARCQHGGEASAPALSQDGRPLSVRASSSHLPPLSHCVPAAKGCSPSTPRAGAGGLCVYGGGCSPRGARWEL